jgi:hypothetical protein
MRKQNFIIYFFLIGLAVNLTITIKKNHNSKLINKEVIHKVKPKKNNEKTMKEARGIKRNKKK